MQNIDSRSESALLSGILSDHLGGLLCLEISSIALGYRVLGIVTKQTDIRVLEASPIGRGFLILATGPSSALDQAVHDTRAAIDGADTAAWIDREVVAQANAQVVEAFFALAQTPLAESLVVLECATVSGCLAAAQVLTQGHGLKPIEIRIQRLSTGGAYGFFTGPTQDCVSAAEDARTKMRATMREGRAEVIEAPTKEFRAYFNLSGESSY